MRKNRKIAAAVGAVLLILIIMIAAAAIRNGYPLKAVYLEKEDGDGIFVNLTAEYPFTGTIPEGELYDEAGRKDHRAGSEQRRCSEYLRKRDHGGVVSRPVSRHHKD